MRYTIDYKGLHVEFENPIDQRIGGGGRVLDWSEDMFGLQVNLIVETHLGVIDVPREWVINSWR